MNLTDLYFSRRMFMKAGGTAAVGSLALATTACPFDGITKDKAVRYTSIAIDYLKDILPIASQIGGSQVAEFVNRAIPALEKLKEALENSEFPTAGNLFDTVKNVISQVATALMQLPDSPRRNMIMGILTLVQISLRTVSLFIDTNAPSPAAVPSSVKAAATPDPLRKAFEATRF